MGCENSVSLKRIKDEPDVLLSRAGQRDHVDASGIAVHKDVGPSRPSKDTKLWVLDQLSAGMPTKSTVAGELVVVDRCSHMRNSQFSSLLTGHTYG
jgi:hypothetical protein